MTREQFDTLANEHGLWILGPVRDERGYGYVLFDVARGLETGRPRAKKGSRFTLAQVERALRELW
jgi:hypothetical protein